MTNLHTCEVHEKTTKLLDEVVEHNRQQDMWIRDLYKKDENMNNRVALVETNLEKIKKYAFYGLMFILGFAANLDNLNVLLNIILKVI